MTGEIYSELTFKKLQELLTMIFKVPPEKIRTETDFFSDLDFSAMQFAELTIQLETYFEKKLFDKNALKLKTVGEIVQHIAKAMGASSKPNRNDAV